MKLASSIAVPALCWTARLTFASSAHVYLHDPQSQHASQSQSRSLQPVPARLVLAQRAGVEDYHITDLSRQESIDAINEYGVRTPLFAAADSSLKKAFILLESEVGRYVSIDTYTSFDIAPAPPGRGLFVDLAKQTDPTGLAQLSDDAVFELLKSSHSTDPAIIDTLKDSKSGDIFYIAQSAADFKDACNRLAATKRWSITALVTPSANKAAKEDRFQWGAYQMPGSESPLRKRQTKDEGWSIYEQGKEEPMTISTPSKSAQAFSAPVVAFANNTKPLRGILPSCFSTQAAAESATRNCTGHGEVVRKYHDSTAKTGGGIDCFVCKCQPTKKNGRTTKWGGPACQKKDVSIEFWLIALFTIGMIFLVGFAVGSVWEMGSQELPSVIGAGVSGPTARK